MLGLLIGVLIVCVVLYCTNLLLSAFKIADPIRTVIFVVVAILCLLWLVGGRTYLPWQGAVRKWQMGATAWSESNRLPRPESEWIPPRARSIRCSYTLSATSATESIAHV